EDTRRHGPLSVMNPVAAQHTYMRTSLRGGLLRTYASNRARSEGPLRLFEVGFEYLPVEADLPHERPVVCMILGGTREARWAGASSEHLDFFDLKGAIEAISASLGVHESFAAATDYAMLAGHTARVLVGREPIGMIAQVHPDTAAAFGIDEPVFLAELWLEDVVRALPERPDYESPSRFPEVRQDIAILV